MSDSTAQISEAAQRPALLSYVRQRQCVLFVGAGLSRGAGYPDWKGLMETVVRETLASVKASSAEAELTGLLAKGRYAELADECREILGFARFAELLRNQLAQPLAPPEATHRAIVETPYAAIVTTNFDTLLEDAYARWSEEGVPKCPTGAQLGRHGTLLLDRTFFILKAHGTIHDSSSLVFTSEDYRRITHANPAFQSVMAAILLTHAIVFVGYSLNDPNFRLLLDSQLSVFGAQAPPRYAVMEGVGSLEAQVLRRSAGIEAISYPQGEHECVATFLSTLAEATRAKRPRRALQRKVLREREPLPALRLAIRPRGAMLDLEWLETTTDDLEGANVPLEKCSMGTASSLPWPELTGALIKLNADKVGPTLARPIRELGVPLLTKKPRLVMLDIPAELAAFPWEWLHVKGQPLCLQTPVCRTVPGFDDASRGRPFFHVPLRVLIIGDALAESKRYRQPLSGTREEAEEIGQLFKSASKQHEVKILVGREASYARVLSEMTDGYDIVHMTGVAYVDVHGGESIIPLHDGEVRASELATLLIRRPPGLLFVNEDRSGFVPPFEDKDLTVAESVTFADFYHRMRQRRPGLERVVARAGVGTFIGCMGPSTEIVAREIAVTFYKKLLAGEPFAQALYLARAGRKVDFDLTAINFAMAGYPDTRLIVSDN